MKAIYIFAALMALIVSGYAQGKQSAAFKNLKKESATLVIFSPVTDVYGEDKSGKSFDKDMSVRDKEIIASVARDLLDSRYTIEYVELQGVDTVKLNEFRTLADEAKGGISGLKQSFLPEIKTGGSRLGILITYNAHYEIGKQVIGGNSVGGVSTMTITPSARPYSDMRLIAFNLETGEIIHHGKLISRIYTPASPADVESITRKVLKDVYYK